MKKKTRKHLASALCCAAAALLLTTGALAVDKEIVIPTLAEGETYISEAESIHSGVGKTTFFLQIEGNPKPYEEGEVKTNIGGAGGLPKTGDSGPALETVLNAALVFGAAYLLCDSYGKKTLA